MSEHHIVVHDPSGSFWEGAIVGTRQAQQLIAEGVDMLPADPSTFGTSGCAGYYRRAWGAGIPLTHVPQRIAPLTLYVMQHLHCIMWCARIVPDWEFEGEHRGGGTIRIAHDPVQANAGAGKIGSPTSPSVDFNHIGPQDARGGWTVRGSCQVSPSRDGFMGISMYGCGRGYRLVWAALTQVDAQ